MAYDDLKILTGVSATSELFPDTVFKHEVAELGFPTLRQTSKNSPLRVRLGTICRSLPASCRPLL